MTRAAGQLLRLAVCACLALTWATAASAQDPSVGDAADRPGFADSAVLVGKGHILFETGFTLEHEGGDPASVRKLTWPQVELHGGLTKRLDLSVIWDGVATAWTHTAFGGVVEEDTTAGLDDFRVGAKFRLADRPGLKAALIGYVNVPVGDRRLSSRYADPLVRVAWSMKTSERTGLNGTVDLQAARDDDDEVRAKPATSAAFNYSFNDSLSSFAGVVAEPAALVSRPTVFSIEAGLIRAVGDQEQVDVWAGRRVHGDIDGWFISGGFIRKLR